MMERNEIIRLAKEATGNDPVYCRQEFTFSQKQLERFAHLVAAEYKRDAERYRMLRSNERFSVDEKCADGHWEPIHYDDLDHALDAAMEKAK